jgi:hypothetical protein
MRLIVLAAFVILVTSVGAVGPAEAVVYCKSAGIPKGCVARPAAGASAAGVAAARPGRGVGGVGGAGAPGGGAGINRAGVGR